MVDWDEIEETLNCLLEVFLGNWWKIISYSFVLLLSLPILEWFILSILYMIFKTPSLLEKFGESTAFNLLPWWVDLITNFPRTIITYCLLVVIVTCIYTYLENK